MKEKQKEQRWWKIKQLAQSDRQLGSTPYRILIELVDYLARSRQKINEPFGLSWRLIQHLSGGAVHGFCEKQCYRIIRQLVSAGYIFPTPRRHVESFIRAKQSRNPAAVKYYNFTFKKLKGPSAKEWAAATYNAIDNPTDSPSDLAGEYGLK